MPKFTITSTSGTSDPDQTLYFESSDGDVQVDNMGNIRYYASYGWVQIGNIQTLFSDVYLLQSSVDIMEKKQKQMEDRIAELVRNRELEEEFPDLGAAGEYCEELRVMLKKANDGYYKMIQKTLEKKEIFEALLDDEEEEND